MKLKKSLTTLLALALVAHCATPPKMVDTAALKAKSQAEREQAYKDNQITPGGLFTPYKVGASPFAAESLDPLFDAPYAGQPAKDKFSSGKTLSTIGGIFAAAGGFMVGWNLGTAARGAETNAGLWAGGGASILIGFIFAGFADGKFTDASKLYNDDLYKALDLQQKTSAVKPQEQFAHYTVGLQQAF